MQGIRLATGNTRVQPTGRTRQIPQRFGTGTPLINRATSTPRFGASLTSLVKDSVFSAKCWVDNTFLHKTGGDTPLQDAVFTVFDLETTGLSGKKNAITELTAIKYRNGKELAKLSTLVKPTEPIPAFITKLTGITEEMVKSAPSLDSVMKKLVRFVGPSPLLVGHHVNFDVGFVRDKLAETQRPQYQNRFVTTKAFCTKTLAQRVLPGLPDYKGVTVAKHLGINNPQAHRAENDVKMTAATFYKLIALRQTEDSGLKTVSDLRNYQGGAITSYNGKPQIDPKPPQK